MQTTRPAPNEKDTLELPRHLSNQSLRVLPTPPLPNLVCKQQPHAERNRKEEVLHRDLTRVDRGSKTRNIQEYKDDDQREQNSWEESEVLSGFVEDWWLLEDREAASTGREQVEPKNRSCQLYIGLNGAL